MRCQAVEPKYTGGRVSSGPVKPCQEVTDSRRAAHEGYDGHGCAAGTQKRVNFEDPAKQASPGSAFGLEKGCVGRLLLVTELLSGQLGGVVLFGWLWAWSCVSPARVSAVVAAEMLPSLKATRHRRAR